ncbi:uncharacterized protein [Miscanthus floridulus]|uniref:uncharacterized protein n=1 Tax=Miscanthus floridulus TaxID=154761 RepID=UPI00345AAD63
MQLKSLFELGVSSTIKGILITSDISHGMPYLPLEKQNNQSSSSWRIVPSTSSVFISKNSISFWRTERCCKWHLCDSNVIVQKCSSSSRRNFVFVGSEAHDWAVITR